MRRRKRTNGNGPGLSEDWERRFAELLGGDRPTARPARRRPADGEDGSPGGAEQVETFDFAPVASARVTTSEGTWGEAWAQSLADRAGAPPDHAVDTASDGTGRPAAELERRSDLVRLRARFAAAPQRRRRLPDWPAATRAPGVDGRDPPTSVPPASAPPIGDVEPRLTAQAAVAVEPAMPGILPPVADLSHREPLRPGGARPRRAAAALPVAGPAVAAAVLIATCGLTAAYVTDRFGADLARAIDRIDLLGALQQAWSGDDAVAVPEVALAALPEALPTVRPQTSLVPVRRPPMATEAAPDVVAAGRPAPSIEAVQAPDPPRPLAAAGVPPVATPRPPAARSPSVPVIRLAAGPQPATTTVRGGVPSTLSAALPEIAPVTPPAHTVGRVAAAVDPTPRLADPAPAVGPPVPAAARDVDVETVAAIRPAAVATEARVRPAPPLAPAPAFAGETVVAATLDAVPPDVPPGGAARVTARPAPPTIPRTAADGASPLVAEAQRGLIRHGYDPGAVDGIAGQRTLVAVRSYQRRNGQRPDGVIDADLLRSLRNEPPGALAQAPVARSRARDPLAGLVRALDDFFGLPPRRAGSADGRVFRAAGGRRND